MKRFNLVGILTLGISVLASSVMAQSITIGAPGDAGSGNNFPFGVRANGHYQQVYNQSLFVTGLIQITEIDFFNTQYGPGAAVLDTANYDIHLSTTSAPVNGLSSTFAANIGGDDAVFFNNTLSGTPGLTLQILGTPFMYNPSAGNLLIDIVKTGSLGDGNGYWDANNGSFGTDSSRMHNFGSMFENWGLVTRFNYATTTDVPEPGTYALFASLGLTAAGFLRRRKK